MSVTTIDADAVLFDSDGVLVDSHDQVVASWSALATEFDLDFERLRAELEGVPAHHTLSRYLAGTRLDAAVVRLEELEVESAARTVAIPGAHDLLASLPAGRVALVTSATRRLAAARWSAAGLPVPPDVVTADEVRLGKPHPEPFLTAAASLGIDARRCAVFEDSVAGGAAALAAGATVVAVGETPWPTDGVTRVRDLTDVVVGPAERGFALTLTITASGSGGRPLT